MARFWGCPLFDPGMKETGLLLAYVHPGMEVWQTPAGLNSTEPCHGSVGWFMVVSEEFATEIFSQYGTVKTVTVLPVSPGWRACPGLVGLHNDCWALCRVLMCVAAPMSDDCG